MTPDLNRIREQVAHQQSDDHWWDRHDVGFLLARIDALQAVAEAAREVPDSYDADGDDRVQALRAALAALEETK